MDSRKNEKITALVIAVVTVFLSLFGTTDWHAIGIYAGCGSFGRMLYPFFHVNVFHALLNAWCLLSLMFIYNIKIGRLLLAYIISVTIPIDTIGHFIGGMETPTVGLSGIAFVLFGTISFEVLRKWYYQAWMLFYLIVGFLFPNTNAYLHLYCYLAGLAVALLNKPIKLHG
jgi:Rhomboid family.